MLCSHLHCEWTSNRNLNARYAVMPPPTCDGVSLGVARGCGATAVLKQVRREHPAFASPYATPQFGPVAPSLKQRFGDWIDARTAQGIETYGGPLTTDNGRDAERDMLEELLDFCQYQEQSRLELLADNAQLRQRIGVARERLGLPELEGYK